MGKAVAKKRSVKRAAPAASQFMLDDAAFDVETWLANEISTEFARAEGAAFVAWIGDGAAKGVS